jgi:hypothetical protein
MEKDSLVQGEVMDTVILFTQDSEPNNTFRIKDKFRLIFSSSTFLRLPGWSPMRHSRFGDGAPRQTREKSGANFLPTLCPRVFRFKVHRTLPNAPLLIASRSWIFYLERISLIPSLSKKTPPRFYRNDTFENS